MNKETLGDRVEFIYGFSVRVEDEPKGTYPIYGSNGATGYIDSFKVEAPGVIIGRKGTVGAVTFSKENFTPTDTTYYLELKNKSKDDLKFWYYYLQLLGLNNLNSHSAVPGLSRDLAYLINIDVPEKITQIKIADILTAIDEKIFLNNKINQELEAMAKTIYNYWFVQFDFPDENDKPYKTSGGEMLWNESVNKFLPKNWSVDNLASSTISKIIDIGINEYDGQKIYLSTSEVSNTEIISHDILESYDSRPSRANMQPVPNSIWFARMKDTKKVLLLSEFSTEIINEYIFSTGFAGIKTNLDALYYLWNFINDSHFEEVKNKLATGSTQKSIINESIEDINLIVPEHKILSMFNNRVSYFYKRIYVNERENLELIHLRDFLLPLLMNGQVKVK